MDKTAEKWRLTAKAEVSPPLELGLISPQRLFLPPFSDKNKRKKHRRRRRKTQASNRRHHDKGQADLDRYLSARSNENTNHFISRNQSPLPDWSGQPNVDGLPLQLQTTATKPALPVLQAVKGHYAGTFDYHTCQLVNCSTWYAYTVLSYIQRWWRKAICW